MVMSVLEGKAERPGVGEVMRAMSSDWRLGGFVSLSSAGGLVVVLGGYRLTTLPLPVDLVELLAFLAPWLDGAVDKVPKEFAMACDMNVGVVGVRV